MATEETNEENLDLLRQMATIQRVSKLEAIPEKDFVELATVMGYKTVVKKGDFKVGDLCVFFEVDSYLDVARPEFAFLAKRAKQAPDGKLRARISPMKIGQAYSEGLAIAFKDLPALTGKLKEDREVTTDLDVLKYERGNRKPPKPLILKRKIFKKFLSLLPRFVRIWLGSLLKGEEFDPGWPGFCPPQTDEPKLKSGVSILRKMQGLECYTSLKMDGSSFTAVNHRGKLTVCSRTRERKNPNDKFVQLATKYDLANKLPIGYSIQGEMLDVGLQGNRCEVLEPELHVFNVFKDRKQLPLDEALEFCKQAGLQHVPVLERFVMSEGFDLDTFTAKVAGLKYKSGQAAEGVVIRVLDVEGSKAAVNSRLSCKVINPVYDLEKKERAEKKRNKPAVEAATVPVESPEKTAAVEAVA